MVVSLKSNLFLRLTNMRKKITLGILIALSIIVIAGCLQKSEMPTQLPTPNQTITPVQPTKELKLSDFPDVFKESTVIVIGKNATQIEMEEAQTIADNLGNLTRNMPIIKTDAEITKDEKAGYNLILVGRPDTNKLLGEVYDKTNATKVTNEYPGVGKGVLEILRSPWNSNKSLLLVEGSNEQGVKAGSEILRYVKELDKAEVVVDWKHLAENKQAVALGIALNEFEILNTTIHEYLYEKYPFLRETKFGIRYEKIVAKVENVPPQSIIIDAYANFRTPPVVVRVAFYDGNAHIISEEIIEDTL
jgi:hypothetical protein